MSLGGREEAEAPGSLGSVLPQGDPGSSLLVERQLVAQNLGTRLLRGSTM